MYLLKLGFLDGKEGFVLATMSAFGVFLKYTKLWKLNKK
jgi:(heptosyl)LPS beta-1,4-glucosyltransferase